MTHDQKSLPKPLAFKIEFGKRKEAQLENVGGSKIAGSVQGEQRRTRVVGEARLPHT